MNECFFIAKIISKIQFDFLIKTKNISIVRFVVELDNKSKINVKGYNEIADKCYKRLRKGDYVSINGRINKNEIEIKFLEKT